MPETERTLQQGLTMAISAGCSPHEALDWAALKLMGYTTEGWAGLRGVGTLSVKQNYAKAVVILNGDESPETVRAKAYNPPKKYYPDNE